MKNKIIQFLAIALLFSLISQVQALVPREAQREINLERKEMRLEGISPAAIHATLAPTIMQLREEKQIRRANITPGVSGKPENKKYEARINGILKSRANDLLVITENGKDYTVVLTDKTKLKRRFMSNSNINEFSVGNELMVIGKWTDDTKTAIEAVLIQNLSIQKRYGAFIGTITSISETGFVIESLQRETQTVNLNNSSRIINRIEGIISLADLQVGHRVRVKGLWDRTLKTISEVSQVKDFSLPPLPTKAALPTATQ